MPSTYTTSLRLTLPATGELAGTWGTTVNAGVTSLAEAAIAGTAAVTMIDADYTLTAVNGSADQSRNMFVTLTGTLTAARNVICPPVSKLYFVTNNTTGGYAITFKTLAGTGISVPNGQRAVLYCNGTDVLGGLTALDSLSLNGSLTLVGGTANTVPYLNGSKVVTTGAALAFDGANLSLGAAPSAWSASYKAYELPAGAVWSVSPTSLFLTSNAYNNGTNYIYKTSNAASQYQQGAGAHTWSVAASGTAGATFSFTTAMTLNASGNLGIGTSAPITKLAIQDTERLEFGGSSGFMYSQTLNAARTATVESRAYASFLSWWTGASGAQTEKMRLDSSGNLGLGVTPSGWGSGYNVMQLGVSGAIYGRPANETVVVSTGAYNDGTSWKYQLSGNFASQYAQASGNHIWYTAPSGTAGNAISFTQAMTLDASGNLGVGTSSPVGRLTIQGAAGTSGINQGIGLLYSNGTQFGALGLNNLTGWPQLMARAGAGLTFHVNSDLVTTGEVMRLDSSGNLGLGVAPSAWSGFKAIQVGNGAFGDTAGASNNALFGSNTYYNGAAFTYINTTTATLYRQLSGQHLWYTAPSGTAGNPITFTQAMTLDASGNLGIGTASPASKLHVSSGAIRLSDGYELGWGDNSAYIAGNGTTELLQFFTASSERMRIDSTGNVGVGTTSPTSTLHVSGSFSRGVPVTKTSNFTLTATENWVIVNNSTSSVTATLPAPSSFPGRELMFVARYATGGGNLVSASSNVVQPDGTVTAVIIPYDVAGRYKFSTIVSDGTNWVVMNRGIM